MKKLLALLLVLVLSLGALAACGGKAEEALAGAADYLHNMYKENNGEETPRDYNVVGKIVIDEETFTVTWTTNSDKISVKESTKAGFWTIDVPDANTEAFNYTITAKIANEDGDTVEKSFNKVMPVVTKNPTVGEVVENTPYKFYLYQTNIKTPLFATHTIDQDKYYASTDNWDEAPDFYVEKVEGGYKFYTTIGGVKKYVNAYLGGEDGTSKRVNYADTTENVWTYNSETLGWTTKIGDAGYVIGTYNTYTTFCISDAGFLTAENSGKTQFPAGFVPAENKQYIPAPEEAVIYETPEEIVNAAYALGKDELLSAGHKYTLTGVITKIDTAWSDQYGNITVSIVVGTMTDKPIQCFRTTGDGAKTLMVGDTITVTGAIKNYNGTVEMEYAKLDSVTKKDFTDAEKLAYEKDALTVATDIKSATTIELPTAGATFNTVAIAWEATGATIENNKIVVTLGDAAVEFTLKATLTCGTEAAVTKEFTVKVAKAPTQVPVVVTAPVAGTAYKFGMVQGNLDNAIYYLAGGMAQTYYLATTDAYASAIDVYLEETTGGYYLYTTDGTTKTYINMVTSESDGTVHVNGAYEATASTVYTFDAEKGTIVATVNEELYWFGTRNDKTHTTVGPVKVSYNGFACKLYTLGDYVEPEQPENPENPVGPTYNAVTELKDGDVVIIGAPAHNMALSADKVDATSYYNKGVSYANGFGDITDAELFVVTVNSDGSYTFTSKTGVVIALAAQYSSLNADGENSTWTLEAKDGATGIFYVKNVGRGNYLEWYASKNNWSTYATESLSDLFELSFYVLSENAGGNEGGEEGGENGGETPAPELTTPEAIVDAAYDLANNTTLAGGPYTLTGVVSQIDKVGTDYVTLWIVVAEKTDKPLQCYHLTGTGYDLLKVGDTVTVTGEIKNFYTSYNNKVTIEFDNPTLDSYAFAQTTDADKIADVKADIDVIESVFQDTTVTLPTTSARHDSVTITWAITEDANSSATLTGAELAIALADTASTLKLTATIASGEASDTLEVEIALAVKPAEGAAATDGRFTEETAYYLTATATDGTVYYFTGAVSSGKGTLTTDVTAAIKLYVDIVDGGYYVYSVDASDVKTYYYIADTSKGVKTAAEASADALLTWNETFSTLQGAGERMFALYGNSNDLRTYGASNIPGSNSNNVVAVLTLANE